MTTEKAEKKKKYRVFLECFRTYSYEFLASSESEAIQASWKHISAMSPHIEDHFDWRAAGWRFEPDWSSEETYEVDIDKKHAAANGASWSSLTTHTDEDNIDYTKEN
jgi:hypothetical protein